MNSTLRASLKRTEEHTQSREKQMGWQKRKKTSCSGRGLHCISCAICASNCPYTFEDTCSTLIANLALDLSPPSKCQPLSSPLLSSRLVALRVSYLSGLLGSFSPVISSNVSRSEVTTIWRARAAGDGGRAGPDRQQRRIPPSGRKNTETRNFERNSRRWQTSSPVRISAVR